MWADIVLEKLLTVLHPDPWAAERETLGLGWALKGSKATPNTSTNTATFPNPSKIVPLPDG